MMVMTAKVNLKKVLLALAAVAALILALIALLGGNKSTQTSAPAVSSNDARVKFLTDFGWEVTTSPVESSQVKIPSERATEPVYATLLIYKNEIIGGDVTDSAPNGQIRGFKMPEKTAKPVTPSTVPSVTTAPTQASQPDTAR